MAERDDLPPDPVIEAYKKDIDVTLLRESLKKTVEERLEALTPEEAIRRARELVRLYVPEGQNLSDELVQERRQERS